jgi:hypothetical protein
MTPYCALTLHRQQVQHPIKSIRDGYYWEECVLVFLEACFVQTTTITRNVDKTTTLLFQKLKPLNNILGPGGINTMSTNEDDVIKMGIRLLYIVYCYPFGLRYMLLTVHTKDRPTRLFRVNNIERTATTLHNVVIHNVFHGRFLFQIIEQTLKLLVVHSNEILTYPCHIYLYIMFYYDVQYIAL